MLNTREADHKSSLPLYTYQYMKIYSRFEKQTSKSARPAAARESHSPVTRLLCARSIGRGLLRIWNACFSRFFPFARQSCKEFGCDIFFPWNPKAVSGVEIFISLFGEALRFMELKFVFSLCDDLFEGIRSVQV